MFRNLTLVLGFSFLVLLISLRDELFPIYLNIRRSSQFVPFLRPGLNIAMSDQTLSPTGRWLQTKFTSLYESASSEEAEFRTQVSFIFHKDVEIFHNHQKVSLGAFQDSLSQANFAQSRASIEWRELDEAPPAEGETESSIIAGSFLVTRSMKFRIRAGPAQRLSHNIFSAKIEQDRSMQADDDQGTQFRITQMFITSIDKAAPIHLPGITRTDP